MVEVAHHQVRAAWAGDSMVPIQMIKGFCVTLSYTVWLSVSVEQNNAGSQYHPPFFCSEWQSWLL